ncbi:MAG: DUF503 domain-containing protein [Candidatus Aminicenantes bacterium]|nr:MAG: DUF503 domain-containing protein [Candidatus Aminicenantes bacterium]
MIVGIMVLDLHSNSTHSLKEKRKIVSSMKEKLKNKFNISLIESDYQDLWQKIQITIAMVANTKTIVEKAFDQMEDFVFMNYPIQVLAVSKDYI